MEYMIDLHQDLLLHVTRRDLFPEHVQTSFELLKKNSIKLTVASAFPVPPQNNFFDERVPDMIESDIHGYITQTTLHPEFTLVRSKGDLEHVIRTDGLFGILVHIEGLNVFSEVEGWSYLDRMFELGLRSIGPVWNYANSFGGGDAGPSDVGLSETGEHLIAWCEEKGVVFDMAHMNEKTFWDSVKKVKRPLYVSHGNARILCSSPRNYSDEQLKAIGESGGVIGVFFSKKYLRADGGATNLDVVRAHIAHIVDVAGEDAVALGSDFGGILSGFPEGLDSVDGLWNFIETLPVNLQKKFSHENAQRVIHATLSV